MSVHIQANTDPTRRILAAWDALGDANESGDDGAHNAAWSELERSIEALRATLAQGQPTAAELLSELTTAAIAWERDPLLDTDTADRLVTVARVARSLGYGAATQPDLGVLGCGHARVSDAQRFCCTCGKGHFAAKAVTQ